MPVATTKELLVHTTNATERSMVSKSCLKLGGMKYHLHELQKLCVYGRTERLVEQHTKLRPAMYVGSSRRVERTIERADGPERTVIRANTKQPQAKNATIRRTRSSFYVVVQMCRVMSR